MGIGAIGGGIADIIGAEGYDALAKGFDTAAGMEDVNAKITGASTDIQASMAQRSIYRAIGGQRSDILGSGFKMSGSALDLARDSAAQGALSTALIENQGAIDQQTHEIAAVTYRAQAAQARAQASAQRVGGFFGIIGGILGLFSDRRLKANIVKVAKDDNGLNVYEFSYIGSSRRYRGYMADEVQAFDPGAVVDAVGFKSVTGPYKAEPIDATH